MESVIALHNFLANLLPVSPTLNLAVRLLALQNTLLSFVVAHSEPRAGDANPDDHSETIHSMRDTIAESAIQVLGTPWLASTSGMGSIRQGRLETLTDFHGASLTIPRSLHCSLRSSCTLTAIYCWES